MSHLTEQIVALEAKLAELKALEKAEDDEKKRTEANRPAGIPPTWLPLLFKVNGVYATVAWYDPAYTLSALKLVEKKP